MSRDEYFAAVRGWPWAFLESFSLDLPSEWVAEAWNFPEVQDNLVACGFARDVSKTGSLCHSQAHLRALAECLGAEQVRRFYLAIRDVSPMREREFRGEFLSGFARHADAIPPALTDGELAALMGFTVGEMYANHAKLRADSVAPQPGDMDDIPF